MGWYGPQGDCGCCGDDPPPGGCTILSDSFDRDDSTDIGTDWDEVEGDWSISSNRLVVSGSGIAATIAQRNIDSNYVVMALLVGGSRLIFDYVDEDNWHALQYNYTSDSSASITVVKCTAGSVSTINTTSFNPSTKTGVPYDEIGIRGCVLGDRVVVNYGTSVAGNSYVVAITPHGGLGAGVGSTGTAAEIDDFAFSYYVDHGDDCPYCLVNCATCAESGVTLPEYIVDLSGFSFANDECDRCVEITGEYAVQYFSDCTWRYNEEGFCYLGEGCNPAALAIVLSLANFSGECYLVVTVRLNAIVNPDNPCVSASFTSRYEKRIPNTSSYDMVALNETLSLISDTQTGCVGSFPATIAVRSP